MRAIVDTNALLSGFLWRGAPHVLLEQVRSGELTLVISPALLAELADVISRLAAGSRGDRATPFRSEAFSKGGRRAATSDKVL